MANYSPDLDRVFGALAEPTRRGIVARLSKGEATLGDLAAPTGLRLPTVMRHVAVLEEAGLVATRKAGRRRICTLQPEALATGLDWMEAQQACWHARLDRLERIVMQQDKDNTDD
ncbi:ArsR/SmtB family transcription factor [Aurantiacibacter luteus]|uniref:ArsR family transcriptional regulator n=1 Tax=Aurantiacibacter luteus TaxID=1581420 RepID=A0A0G9MV97_9SPHN|nr:metalloregulator ArsR/SmtB family transcription factor [Aurantiacibacter luteus]KLE34524.1 ArsR family transcriptional regulator [Aurantiacibacter luteus]